MFIRSARFTSQCPWSSSSEKYTPTHFLIHALFWTNSTHDIYRYICIRCLAFAREMYLVACCIDWYMVRYIIEMLVNVGVCLHHLCFLLSLDLQVAAAAGCRLSEHALTKITPFSDFSMDIVSVFPIIRCDSLVAGKLWIDYVCQVHCYAIPPCRCRGRDQVASHHVTLIYPRTTGW